VSDKNEIISKKIEFTRRIELLLDLKRAHALRRSFCVTRFHNSAECSQKRFNLFNFVRVGIKRKQFHLSSRGLKDGIVFANVKTLGHCLPARQVLSFYLYQGV